MERNNLRFIVSILLIFGLFISQDAFAQCCSAGNPFVSAGQDDIVKKQLKIGLGYTYSLSDNYYKGSEKFDINFIDKAQFDYLFLNTFYSLTERIGVKMELGYFIDRSEFYHADDWQTSTGSGLGDASFEFKYLLLKSISKKLSIVPSFGMKLPIGVFDQEKNNVKLPLTVQPSSGSYKYSLAISIKKQLKNLKWYIGFLGSAEYAQLINSQNFYYKYGNSYRTFFLISHTLNDRLSFGLQVKNELKARASREEGRIVEASGYFTSVLIPNITLSISPNWVIFTNIELPVYRHYNGVQLGNKAMFSISLSHKFSFSKPKAVMN